MSATTGAILRLLVGRIESIVSKISDNDFDKRPAPNLNPPQWLLGHLAVSIDAVSKFAGEPYHLPQEWHDNFNSSSSPFENKTSYPTRSELMDAMKAVVERSIDLADTIPADSLAAEHGLDSFAGSPISTTDDIVTLLLTGHIGWHLGHIDWAAKLFENARR